MEEVTVKDKEKILLIPLFIIVLLTICFTPVSAQTPLRDKLEAQGYIRLNVWTGQPTTPFSKSEKTSVSHGWVTDDSWKDLQGSYKGEFMRTASFQLFITPPSGPKYEVNLRRYQWIGDVIDPDTGEVTVDDAMYVIFWVTFPAYTFEHGVYTFEGVWNTWYRGMEHTELKTAVFEATS